MKRILALLLCMVYLGLCTGLSLNVHYCMGQRIGTHLVDQGNAHFCSHCGMEKTTSGNGCCHNKLIVIKGKLSEAAFKTAFPVLNSKSIIALIPFTCIVLTPALFKPEHFLYHHSPPDFGLADINIRNCSLLI